MICCRSTATPWHSSPVRPAARPNPKRGPPIPDLLLLAAAWTAWCLVHSLLILPAFTDRLRRRLPGVARWYRLLYNGFAGLSLIPVMVFERSLRAEPLLAWSGPWRLLQAVLVAAAIALFLLGARGHDVRRFLGLAPATGPGRLDTTGILGQVRHPWYLGGILLIWAVDLTSVVLVRNGVLTTYLLIGAWWEERKLIAEFGDAYREYRRRVPMFLPRLRRRRAINDR